MAGPLNVPSEDEDYAIVPPDGGWGWVVVLASFYCQLVIDGIQLSFGMILKEIADSYGVPYSSVSLIGSIMYGMHYLGGPICAALSYSFGERPVCIFGSVLACAALSSAYFRPPIYILYITIGFFGGFGLCFLNMNSIVITSLYFSSRRILAVGIVVCGTGAGTMVFAVLANVILKTMEWEWVCVLEGALALSMVAAAATFRPLKPTLIQTEADITSVEIKEQESDEDEERRPSHPRIYYISKPDFLSPRQSRSREGSISSFVEHTGQALEDLATAVTHSHVDRKQPRCLKLCVFCCPCVPHHRVHRVLAMNPAFKKSVLHEDPEHGVRRISTEDGDSPSGIGVSCQALCKHVMSAMMDCRILGSYYFVNYCIGGALSASALIIVVYYEKVRILSTGATNDEAMWYIVFLGGANMIWRLILGMLGMIPSPQVNYNAINIAGLLMGGIATAASGLSPSKYYTYFCGAMYGLAIACFAVFYPVILIELVGKDRISNATGITMLFMGAFSIIGAPLSGLVMEMTEDIDAVFYIAGAMFTLSGFLFIFITGLRKRSSSYVATTQLPANQT